ncbi:efflux RND transporter periplasmic adaptor subunit [Legionella sp. km772]|uniref:efflux RND transporter periplasmic adaptor subunit n=1 Tax=Legionella sp. km772 TaxID=2498111 RepID=UPI0013155184|nr:efflux RND transporter periplasmic adaptor subunit [Legionella sp. km772]
MLKASCRLIPFLFIAGLIACGETSDKKAYSIRPVKAILISNAAAFNNHSFPGKAKASQEVDLSFNEGGSLIALPIKIGDKVKKGELIAKLDPKTFDAKLKAASAEVLRDKQNFSRAQELIKKGHISKADFDLLKAKLAVSEANMDLAQKALNDSVLLAPFAGQVADRYVENYQTVSKQQVIARLLDNSQIEMVIQIPENAISLVPYAKDIVVQFDSFPQHLIPAQIKEISNEASIDTRTYPVTLIMQQPKDIEILPGMAGKVRGKVNQGSKAQNKIVLPVSALMTVGEDNKSYVWVIDPKTQQVHRQQVIIGELTETGITIVKGIRLNEWIVIAGVHSLQEGDKVRILNQQDNK